MPVGASKLGVLGAGLVPGGSVTFNASGTWDVPPGVKKVSITGKGGTGNPGNAGNQGNPGNPGTGGAGGGGGNSLYINTLSPGGKGGAAWFASIGPCKRLVRNSPEPLPTYAKSGGGGVDSNNPSQAGETGNSGNAGTAGNPGNPGNPGCSSSALCNTFPGGAGGNAGVAGSAGNAGSGGTGGGGVCRRIGPFNTHSTISGGTGGNGGGSGGPGPSVPLTPTPLWGMGGSGGAGAGSVNSGQNGNSARICPTLANERSPIGGTGNASAPAQAPGNAPLTNNIGNIGLNPNSMGGIGGSTSSVVTLLPGSPSINLSVDAPFAQNLIPAGPNTTSRQFENNLNPACARPDIFRSGGGGGGAGRIFMTCTSPTRRFQSGAGGGGGGRGNAGNPGGPTPTPSGQAATPLTFNCVSVTPGSPTPVTVASPGGQIVISWNPQ